MFNWGIAGTGTVAHEFATALTSEGYKIYAVSSRTLNKAKAFGEKYDIAACFGSYEAMLSDEKVDIIYIATPHPFHFEMIKQALNAGKHVLCEKAITMTAKELETVMTLAKEKNKVLAEGTTIFYMPLYHELQKHRAQFGTLKMIQANFGSFKDDQHDNRFFDLAQGGGALLDIGPYAFGICRYFMSEQPNIVSSVMEPHPSGVDESSVTLLQNQYHELASISMTFKAKMPKRVIIAFDKGYLTIDNYPRAKSATFTTPQGESTTIQVQDHHHAFVHEVMQVEEWIQKGIQSPYLPMVLDIMYLFDEVRQQW